MPRPLKVGVQLPETEYPVRWADIARMARLVEDLGFDSVWIGDHLLYRPADQPPRGPWECWTLLAAIAASTERVEIGPLVACASFHSPAILAKMATTVDEISGGRLILGLGAGWHEPEYTAFGIPYDHRASRFAEAWGIIRDLVRTGEVDFDGEYWSARECLMIPRGPRPEGIPLMAGTFGDRMLATTMPDADLWNAWYGDYGNTLEGLVALMAKVDAACEGVGRDPRAVGRTAALLVGATGSTRRNAISPEERAIPPIRASHRELADLLRAYADAGIGHVQLVIDPITDDAIREVAPVLAELDRA